MDEPKRYSPLASRDGEPRVHGSASVRNARLGRFSEIKERVQFWDSELGNYSYVERHSEVIYSRIGNFAAIASDVRINALQHPIDRVTQHKISYRPNEYFAGAKIDRTFREKRRMLLVEIGHDAWIGHGAIIMPGIRIGDGAVIAAGAVVTRHVEPYAIVGGVPAKFMRWRFPPNVAVRIVRLAWWNWDHDRLALAVADMKDMNVSDFLAKYEAQGS